MIENPVEFLQNLFQVAVDTADPSKCLANYLPAPPNGRVVVIGAGKASAAMAQALEKEWPDVQMEGIVVTRYGYHQLCTRIRIIEAAHPVPDDAGEKVAREILDLVEGLGEDDTVIALISGGGSSLLSLPASCLTAVEKRDVNKALLKSGAPIQKMNTVRKHLSSIKGGRLAEAVAPAKLITYLISDIPGDEPSAIASGPTLPDPTSLNQAIEVINDYKIPVSDKVMTYLNDASNETPKGDETFFEKNEIHIIAKAGISLSAAAEVAQTENLNITILGDDIEGEARVVARDHANLALKQENNTQSTLLISGGETTVTVRGDGRGGRNAEYLLSALIASGGHPRMYGIACDTDGIDGSEDNAGAYFTPQCWGKARDMGLDCKAYLENNDAYSLFEKLGTLIKTGPTRTNVNDFRALLVL
ncbi:MAG: glycerate kinase [Alphaproteobacteria bacterium]|nr:glycerate kinase [Alphaproteobacteria bacterium]